LPELQRRDRRRRIEGALALLGLEVAARLPQEGIPGEILIVAGIRLEQHAVALRVGELLGDREQLLPGLGNVVVGKSGLLEGVDAVVHRHRLDLVREAVDLAVDHAIGDYVREKVVPRRLLHERRQVEQDAAIVIAEEIARADDEKIGPRAGRESGRQLGAVHVGVVRHINELDLHVVAIVPGLDDILVPFLLRRNAASGRVELPEF
jgi:hypothetical protein